MQVGYGSVCITDRDGFEYSVSDKFRDIACERTELKVKTF